MPRANRYFLPGYAWHITQRCHKKEFLLKFSKDRSRWRYWLFQAKRRYGLCILNYIVTSNHIHLLVFDRGKGEIAKSMQLIAGRTAQEYNRRKERRGAFWEDRYHATAVDTDEYLAHCIAYIDLNMVRAGAVTTPDQWRWCGYKEILLPPKRYSVIDLKMLLELTGINSLEEYQSIRKARVADTIQSDLIHRNSSWSKSLAIGSPNFIDKIKSDIGISGKYRSVFNKCGVYSLQEPALSYNSDLSHGKIGLSKRLTIYPPK